eukprot:gene28578-31742_t
MAFYLNDKSISSAAPGFIWSGNASSSDFGRGILTESTSADSSVNNRSDASIHYDPCLEGCVGNTLESSLSPRPSSKLPSPQGSPKVSCQNTGRCSFQSQYSSQSSTASNCFSQGMGGGLGHGGGPRPHLHLPLANEFSSLLEYAEWMSDNKLSRSI